ncbi:hypothetical protein [Actinoplanes sp. NPDC023714]|uniref:hypothetical protein n=1 Tax=Actinoplanes sp. NPDC023714 TaxID=3154322 RepID=UPI0033F9E1CD
MNLATIMACATCHLALTVDRDGTGERFRHPITEDDHEVVPVDADPVSQVFNRCHTCTNALPIWEYRTGLIAIADFSSGAMKTYNDQWHVCYQCAQFIEAGDAGALTAYCATFLRWPSHSDAHKIVSAVHQGIVLGREGRTLLTTTRWAPARITAAMLPKVRDRLAGLLRGPVALPEPINESGKRQAWAKELERNAMHWVTPETAEAVNAATGDQPPARLRDDLLPTRIGLLVWPRFVGEKRRLAAVSWMPEADGWRLIGYGSIGGGREQGPDLSTQFRHEIGWLLPIHTEHVSRRTIIDGSHPLGPFITTLLLIKQELAEAVPAKLPKGITKAYEHRKRAAPDVRVIRNRPPTAAPSPGPVKARGSGERARPDYRFWVSGHERQQACGPGRSQRKKIDIDPFLKGDPSLPIKLSTTVRVHGSRADSRDPDSAME